MSHHAKSLKYQSLDRLENMAAYGQSKHAAKKAIHAEANKIQQTIKDDHALLWNSADMNSAARMLENAKQKKDSLEAEYHSKIYSRSTMNTYKACIKQFTRWATKNTACKTLEDAMSYGGAYLRSLEERGLSAYTIAKHCSALCKLFQCSQDELMYFPPRRHRSDVTLHTGQKWTGHYSEARHLDIKEICESSGLRRRELEQLQPKDVSLRPDGTVVIHVPCGKGGRARDVICLNDAPLKWAQKAAAKHQVFVISDIPNRAPIHEYRQHYANALYAKLAASEKAQANPQRYQCRLDMSGVSYNRYAMEEVSRNLGHNRLDVVTSYVKDPTL